MNGLARAVAIGAVLRLPLGEPALVVTVAQRDAYRTSVEPASVAVSGDGRYVAFTSRAQLAPADTNDQRDVYVLDRTDGRVTLESRALNDDPLHADSEHPSISTDGRWLAYVVANKVVVRDRSHDENKFVIEGGEPAISANGAFLAFTSRAAVTSNRRVHLLQIDTGVIRDVGVDSAGTGSNAGPSVSGDGRLVAFSSTPGRGAGDGKPLATVYITDTQLNTTKPVAPGSHAQISADGRFVAFVSTSSTLVRGDRNNSLDVFLADLQTGSIEAISRTAKGECGNGASTNPAVSRSGRFVAFQSDASDLVCAGRCKDSQEDINLLWDVFIFDRELHQTVRVSSDPATAWMEDSSGPAIDASGAVIAFSSRHPINANDIANDFDLFIRQIFPN